MTDEVSGNFDTLMHQASYTTKVWLLAAIETIDEALGEGYAAKNPVLLQGMLIAAGLDEHAMLTKAAGQDIRDAIDGNDIAHVADALLSISEALKD